MNSGRTIFAQLMDLLPLAEFRRCVERYDGDYKVQSFSCLDQFLCLAYAQLTYRESLRDLETCLRAHARQLYHMGFRGGISRNNLANANRQRDWRIYADFARVLIAQARALYQDEPFGVELDQTVYAFDSTTIDLCLALFPWAQFRRHKSAVKLHTLLDLRGSIPTAIYVTGGQVNDVKLLDQLVWEAGVFYLLDRGYIDYRRLYLITQALAFFVTRADQNLCYRACEWRGVDHAQGLRSDQTIRLTGRKSSRRYPAPLRRIHYFDVEKDLRLVFLTNNFHLAPRLIAQLYRARWQVELFFRWIKQHLHIQAFYGLSENAVKTQVWVAISVYVLVAILKKQLRLDISLHKILQILSVTTFEKSPISLAFLQYNEQVPPTGPSIQLDLFNL
jgi:transposase